MWGGENWSALSPEPQAPVAKCRINNGCSNERKEGYGIPMNPCPITALSLSVQNMSQVRQQIQWLLTGWLLTVILNSYSAVMSSDAPWGSFLTKPYVERKKTVCMRLRELCDRSSFVLVDPHLRQFKCCKNCSFFTPIQCLSSLCFSPCKFTADLWPWLVNDLHLFLISCHQVCFSRLPLTALYFLFTPALVCQELSSLPHYLPQVVMNWPLHWMTKHSKKKSLQSDVNGGRWRQRYMFLFIFYLGES